MKTQRQRKQQPTPPTAVPVPKLDRPPPVDPVKVRLAAVRELTRILNEEDPAPFILPETQEPYYRNTPEHTFCLLVQGGYGLNSLQISTCYRRATIINALVALACGADVSGVAERRVV